jgi:hypothetical protein
MTVDARGAQMGAIDVNVKPRREMFVRRVGWLYFAFRNRSARFDQFRAG